MSRLEITHSVDNSLEGQGERAEYQTPYEQGPNSGIVQFSLTCRNVPIGSIVGFRADQTGPTPSIELSPTRVMTYPDFVTGMQSEVPANYSAQITYYVDFAELPAANAKVQFHAAQVIA